MNVCQIIVKTFPRYYDLKLTLVMQKSSLIRQNQADVLITFAKITQIYFYCTDVSWEENSTHLQKSDIIIFAHAKICQSNYQTDVLDHFWQICAKIIAQEL